MKAALGVSISTVRPRSSRRRSKAAEPSVSLNWMKSASWFSRPIWVFVHPRTKAWEPIWISMLPGESVEISSPGTSGVLICAVVQSSAPGRQNETRPSARLSRGGVRS